MNSNKKNSYFSWLNSTALVMCLITENMFCRTHLCLWELKCSILLHKGHTMQENITVVYVMYSNIIQALTIINTIVKCKTHSLESKCTKLLKIKLNKINNKCRFTTHPCISACWNVLQSTTNSHAI